MTPDRAVRVALIAILAGSCARGPRPDRAAAPAPEARTAPAAATSSGPALASRPKLVIVDDFENLSPWTVHPAEGVTAAVASDSGAHGKALRLVVRFARGTGYAVVRRAVSLDLPADYAFRFQLRGEIPVNHLEFKLADSTGQNVWWHVRRDLRFPRTWQQMITRSRHVHFAWGPAGGGIPRHVSFIEFAISTGEGGAGSVWIDDLTFETLAPDSTAPRPTAEASTARADRMPAMAIDGDSTSWWASAPNDSALWFEIDLGRQREFGGLAIDWQPGAPPPDYVIELSLDRTDWTVRHRIERSNGARDALYLPDSEARYIRIRATGDRQARVMAIREVGLRPLEWSASPEAFFTELAAEWPRGSFPRPYSRQQCAWAVVGSDGGREEALLSEDGMLETGKGRFSIEPFLYLDGRLVTWTDVTIERGLANDLLPIPWVRWAWGDLRLNVTAFAGPDTANPSVFARYRLSNTGPEARHATLYLAARPFQVNPPWQTVGTAGGTTPIRTIAREGDAVWVNGALGFISLTPASGFGATTFDRGDVIEALRAGRLPEGGRADDPLGFGSGAFGYGLDVPAGGEREILVEIPLRRLASRPGRARLDSLQAAVVRRWEATLGSTSIEVPESGRDAIRTLEAQVGWILVNRDGSSLQPGSRSYDRSWIRDGSLTSSALLRLGHPEVVRDFIEWFGAFQSDNGKIPCCASERGPDPVTENDSHGEFLFLIADYHRMTGDAALVRRQWPRILRAVAHMDSLRAQRRTDEWRVPERRQFFGLLLPSISHEGYPNPVHSYWDDFFAYRGYQDAVYLAGVVGGQELRQIAGARDTFAHDLAASVAATMSLHRIDYVPGCAELGDFDATSTTVALAPTGAADLLPAEAVRRTFERYWEFFRNRRDGKLAWDGFTPYEVRVIGSFVRLGWRDRAQEALQFFLAHRKPKEWRQWAEVEHREPRAPKFLGDLPHTWVGSDFVRSVLDLFAYERGTDSTLVLAAGIPFAWVEGEGARVRNLHTVFGPLSYHMRARGDAMEVTVEKSLRMPPGGILVLPPARRTYRSVRSGGAPGQLTREGGVLIRTLPAQILFEP